MKSVELFEKGEHILLEFEVTKVSLVGSIPHYELKDPITGEFLDGDYTADRFTTIPKEEEA